MGGIVMATTINAAASAGLVTTADTSQILQLQTGGTTAVTIDASQNVGIGTSSPAELLTVSGLNKNVRIQNTGTTSGGCGLLLDTANTVDPSYKFIQGSTNSVAKWAIGNCGGGTGVDGSLQFFTGGINERMRIDSSGNLLVGATSGSYKITCNGQPGANGYTAWTNYSDQRLKENIVDFKGGLKEVLNLKPKSFNYNELSGYDEETRARTMSGFIAQELELICPEMVGTTEIDGVEYLDTNTSNLNLLLVRAIQELKAIIDTQNARIEALEAK